MKKIRFLLILTVSLAFLYSCEKDQGIADDNVQQDDVNDIENSQRVSEDQSAVDDIFEVVEEISSRRFPFNMHIDLPLRRSDCATITIDTPNDTIHWPKTVTIDFGEEGCVGSDGVLRKGKIIAVFTGPLHRPGNMVTINLENYMVNRFAVEGTKQMKNIGRNDLGMPQMRITVVNASITAPNGKESTHESIRVRTFSEGFDTPHYFQDDVYRINGHASGINFNEKSWEMHITEPLKRLTICQWFVAGSFVVDIEGRLPREIDFGNGVCDDIATITVGGVTHTIHLP